jgi:hypothetical protein
MRETRLSLTLPCKFTDSLEFLVRNDWFREKHEGIELQGFTVVSFADVFNGFRKILLFEFIESL